MAEAKIAVAAGKGEKHAAYPLGEAPADTAAHMWHASRRGELVQNQGVKELIRQTLAGRWREALRSSALALGVITTHAATALAIKKLAASPDSPRWTTTLVVVGASVTVGAQCAFLIQALNHELSHALPINSAPTVGFQMTQASLLTIGVGGAALCHMPWAAYYFSGSHLRHHQFAGSRRDADAEALFFLWKSPLQTRAARFCWLSTAAIIAPLTYTGSVAKYCLIDFRANLAEIRLMAIHWFLAAKVFRAVGCHGSAFLLLSSFFSMGFLAHPLAGFWILQHLCVGDKQPTVSYYGSPLWNALCLNELYHVEHHDFAGISWRVLPRLREEAPDMYDNLYCETSIWSVLASWLKGDDPRYVWDFACRESWALAPRDVPGTDAPVPQRG